MSKVKFLDDVHLLTGTQLQIGDNSTFSLSGDNLVINNSVGDIVIGDGTSDIYVGDGTSSVDILFEQSGAIKAEDGSSNVTLTLGSSDTSLILVSPTISGSSTINNKLTLTTANGYILFDYEPSNDTGEYTTEVPLLKIDQNGTEKTILSRISEYGAIQLGHDDSVLITAGDTGDVIKSNWGATSEFVVFASENGFQAYAFPNNDPTWSNRNEFRFYGASTTASDNGLYIGDGGNTQFIDINRNLVNIGTIDASGVITTTAGGSLFKKVQSSWTNETTHDLIYQGWNTNTGDYIYLKSPGNSTTDHGIAFIGDSVIALGRTDNATGVPELTSATAPISENWFVLNSTSATFSGRVSVTGDISADNYINIEGATNPYLRIQDTTNEEYLNLYSSDNESAIVYTQDTFKISSGVDFLNQTPILTINSSGNATFANDVTVDGGDFNLTKQNGSPYINMLWDGNNPTANTLLHYLNYKVDYGGTHQDWGGIEHRTTTSATRTELRFNVKSTSGNVQNALTLQGQTSAVPNATFAGNVTVGGATLNLSGTSYNFVTSDANVDIGVSSSAHNVAGYTTLLYAGSPTAGTTNNIAGGHLYLAGGAGKGTGAGGDIIFRVAPAGSSGSTVNAYTTALTISDDKSATFAGKITAGDSGGTNGSVLLQQTYSGNDIISTIGTMYSSGGLILGYGIAPKNGSSGFISTADNAAFQRAYMLLDNNEFTIGYAAAQTTAVGSDITGLTTPFTLDITTGNATFTGTIGASNFSGSSSGTNTGDQDLSGYAPLASPTFTGTPAAPTAAAGTNTTQLATTAFVSTAVSNLVDSAPATLDTLNELAAALGDDADFSTTVTNSIAGKVSKSGDTMTGSLTIGDGTADTRLIIKRLDSTVSDDIQFYNGTTRVGEIGTQDTTWLRINQNTSKNIYTPRYIRADGGFFVDATSKGINGSGNFIGGTITGASDANVSNWDTAYSWGNHADSNYLQSSERDLATNSTGTTSTDFVTVYNVDGNNLAAHVRLSVTGTTGNVVVSCVADIIVNHSQDIFISSMSGNYTQLDIKVTSDNNENFAIECKRTDSQTTQATLRYSLVALSQDTTITQPSSHSYTGTSFTHRTKAGSYQSASDGADHAYFNGMRVGNYIYHDGDTNTYVKFDADRIRLVAGGTTKIDTNSTYLTGNQTITLSGDVSGSGTTSIAVTVADDSHNHIISNVDGLQSALDNKTGINDIRSLGVPTFTAGTNPNITTAQLIGEIETDGGFDSYSSVFKTTWSYAGNYNLSDAGRFTETAGTSWITWTDNSDDTTRGNVTALAICPTTGGSAGKVFIYNDQGSSYNAGWREVWTNTSDGTGSGLDADLLDGLHASSFLQSESDTLATVTARGASTTLNIETGQITVTHGVPTLTLSDSGNGSGGGAEGRIIFENTAGKAIGIGYTADDTSTSDLLISTNAASTYGGYLDLDAAAINDATADIILDPKSKVTVNSDLYVVSNIELGDTADTTLSRHSAGNVSIQGNKIWHAGGLAFGYSESGKNYPVELDGSNNAYVNVPWTDSDTVYTHPTHPGDDISIDTGALTGATVISDLDFNVTTDTLGHVTDANATIATRNLTAANIGAAPSSHTHDDRYYTETEIDSQNTTLNETLAHLRGWVPGYGQSSDATVRWNRTEDALELQSGSDTSTGAVYQARRVEAGETVRFTVMVKGSAVSTSGLYLRLYQHDGDMPDGKTHVSNSATGTYVQEDDRGDSGWYENSSITTSWTTFEREYTAPVDGYVSLVILNWTGIGTNSVYIKTPDIQTTQAANSNKLDSLDSSQFLRSDADDNVTGHTEWQDGYHVRLGNSADMRLYHTGGHSYIDNNTGNLYIRANVASDVGGNIHLRPHDDENGVIIKHDAEVELYYNNALKMETTSTGVSVTGSVAASGAVGNLNSSSDIGQQMEYGSTAVTTLRFDSDRWRLYSGGVGGVGERFTVTETGRVGINDDTPDYTLDVSGNVSNISIYASHDVAAYSDARVKTDIKTIPNALDKVNKLRGVTFKRTDEGSTDKRMMGVIAQEVLDIIPEVVNQRESDGHYSVSYGNMVGVLIEAVKELTAEVEELKKLKCKCNGDKL